MLKIMIPLFCLISCAANSNKSNPNVEPTTKQKMEYSDTLTHDTATFGAGCFWCVEAIFLQLKGVYKVESGYSGGTIVNPSYKQVCSGNTGHAEVCQVLYNPQQISFDEDIYVHWDAGVPQANRLLPAQSGPLRNLYHAQPSAVHFSPSSS